MAIKTTIQNLINNQIRSNPGFIDKTEHADVEDALLDNAYGNAISETNAVGTITVNTSDLNFYTLSFCKQGRKVSVKGVLINKQTSITSSTSFFEIINSEFFPSSSVILIQKIYGNASNDNRPIKLIFTASNKLQLSGSPLGVGNNIFVDFEYLTQN